MSAVVEARDVFRIYKEGAVETVALRGVDLNIEAGAYLAIQGRSGSGKSSLLALLGAMDIPDAGSVRLAGLDVTRASEAERSKARRRHVGFVFQRDNLIPGLTVLENVALPLVHSGMRQRAARRRAEALLGEVGLADRIHHRPGQLSGGQNQRAGIAAAVISEPDLLLADEPTGELDHATADMVMNVLEAQRSRTGMAAVLVTHNPVVAARADVRYRMSDGRLEEEA